MLPGTRILADKAILQKRGTMNMNIPKDPVMLLSFTNTQLRDFYSNLDDMCESLAMDRQSLEERLGEIDYHYDQERNQFI
jgi:hypothetical protein